MLHFEGGADATPHMKTPFYANVHPKDELLSELCNNIALLVSGRSMAVNFVNFCSKAFHEIVITFVALQ